MLLENLGAREESLLAWWIVHSLPSQREASAPVAELGFFWEAKKVTVSTVCIFWPDNMSVTWKT